MHRHGKEITMGNFSSNDVRRGIWYATHWGGADTSHTDEPPALSPRDHLGQPQKTSPSFCVYLSTKQRVYPLV